METTNDPTTPLFKKIVPARGAAQKAAATLREQAKKRPRRPLTQNPAHNSDESQADDTDDGSESAADDTDIETSPKGQAVGSVGLGTRGRGRGRGTGVRRRSSQKSTRAVSPPSRPVPSSSFVTPQKRSGPLTSDGAVKRPKLTNFQSRTSGKPIATAANLLAVPPVYRSSSKYANIYVNNDVVWVRLDSRGALATTDGSPDGQLSYWWPAQVTSDDPLVISTTLLGDDGHGIKRHIDISSPNSSTVLSFRDSGRVRFSTSTFTLPDELTEHVEEISTLEVPSELVRRWTEARDQALEADVDYELLEAPSLSSLLSASRKGKRKEEDHMSIPNPQTSPPARMKKPVVVPLDEEIKVGEQDGELVLASDHKGRPDHWPARVVGVHQDKRTGKWLYEIMYIDGKRKKMERSRFFSSDEEGFATCQIGQWRTELPASDTEGPDTEDEMRGRYNARSPSPSPSNSDIEDIQEPAAFRQLPLEMQMRYVYPFLCRVIRKEYEPAFDRHDMFMRGGKARQQLGQAASTRGQFSENEVKKVLGLVRRTMLRNERWAKRIRKIDDIYEAPPPVNGSDGMIIRSVAESMSAPSSDMDAATALTELKSSDDLQELASSLSAPPFAPEVANSLETGQLEHANHPSSQTVMTEIDTELRSALPSSTVLDQTSDMDLDSDEEREQSSLSLPHIAPSSYHKTPEVSASSPPSLSIQEHSVPSEPRRRPKGCDEYENLSRADRGPYCADVLFPEAVLQLHLLRSGKRRSAHSLTPKEENALYEEGQELLSGGVHWITQIVQMRRLAENTYKKRTKKEEAPMVLIGGTSTRPKAQKVSQ